MSKPHVGQIIHYQSYGSADGTYASVCRAAIVTEVADDGHTVGLCAINPTGQFFHSLADGGCQHSEGARRGGTWHWPCGAEE